MTRIAEMHKVCSKEPKYRKAYDARGREFALARTAIEERKRIGRTEQRPTPVNAGTAKIRVRARQEG